MKGMIWELQVGGARAPRSRRTSGEPRTEPKDGGGPAGVIFDTSRGLQPLEELASEPID
jgi:hypothetical protein